MSKFIRVVLGLVLVNVLLFFSLLRVPPSTLVHFLDVGQGDAVLIVTPDLQTVLIDGGPGEGVLEELGKVLPFFVRKIDIIIATHPHRDHIEGLIEVLKRYKVGHVLLAGDHYGSSLYIEFLKSARQLSTVHFVSSKNDFKVKGSQDDDDILFDILHPIDLVVGEEFENTNNASVVVRMSSIQSEDDTQEELELKVENGFLEPKIKAKSLPGQRFLFTGDCEDECEHEMLSHYAHMHDEYGNPILNADVLKVGHHGSRTSTTQEFLDAVSPKIAVIQSEAGNKFKHPHPETLQKFQEAKVQVRRNDLEGTITIPY